MPSPAYISSRRHCSTEAGTCLRDERSGADCAEGQGGAQRGLGRLGALVLLRAGQARPVEALLLVIQCQDPEAHGLARVERDPGQTVGGGGGDEVEVRRPAADDDAEGDDGIRAGIERRLARHRELERPGHAHEPP